MLYELKPVFVKEIPKIIEEGILYISREYHTAIHLCACGCKEETVTPLVSKAFPDNWELTEHDGLVTLSDSIGNWQFPCRSHYRIENNKVIWIPNTNN